MATQAAKRNPIPQEKGQLPAQDKIFRDFKGINTQAARQAIEEGQFSWLENLMPIGYGNLKVVPAQSAIKATLAATAYYRKGYNIAGVAYNFYACSNGAAYQVNLTSYAITLIAAAGTFPASGTQIAQWKNERILIINSGNYYDWNGVTLTTLGGTTSAPSAGQCIATYASRVWISNGRTINYSKAASYTDFGAPGGNTVISDSTLIGDIVQLLSANNFLYFFGLDSINVIADVSVNAAGTVTLFSNTNISANSGTSLPQAIFAYYRAIWYMNTTGIFGLYGATPRKASDDLDGIFQNIDFTKPVTSGAVVIYNILCAAFMFTYNDPDLGARPLMAVYFNKKWFVASQGSALIGMTTIDELGSDNMHADDGTNIYDIFASTTAAVSSKLKTALWDFAEMVREKQALKIGIETNTPTAVAVISPTVDTELFSTAPTTSFASSFDFTWFGPANASGQNDLILDATTGTYAVTVDSSPLDIAGDLRMDFWLAADSWTPATTEAISAKGTTFDEAYAISLLASGALAFFSSSNGITFPQKTSTASVPALAGAYIWIRVEFDVDNGSAGNTTTFFTSPDGIVWTQLGAPVIVAGTTSIHNSAEPLYLGRQTGSLGTSLFSGKIRQSKIYSGIGGAAVLKAQFSANDAAPGQNAVVSSTTGETYFLYGDAQIEGTRAPDNSQVFPWTNSLGNTFTWLASGYVWLISDVQTQGHYLGITVTSQTPQVEYLGMQLQYRMLPGGWWS